MSKIIWLDDLPAGLRLVVKKIEINHPEYVEDDPTPALEARIKELEGYNEVLLRVGKDKDDQIALLQAALKDYS